MQLPPRRKNQSTVPASGFEAMVAGASDSPILENLNNAMRSAATEYKHTLTSVERIGGDKTLTAGARLVRQATVARTKMSAAFTALEKARANATEGRKANEAELHKALDFSGENLAAISLASELRSHFKNLPAEQRFEAIQKAQDDFDLTTLRAIASVPAVLSGMPDQLHAGAREKVFSVVAPDALARSKTLGDGINFAKNFEDQLRQAVADAVDFATADELAKGSAE